jgi:hypothetical protein
LLRQRVDHERTKISARRQEEHVSCELADPIGPTLSRSSSHFVDRFSAPGYELKHIVEPLLRDLDRLSIPFQVLDELSLLRHV